MGRSDTDPIGSVGGTGTFHVDASAGKNNAQSGSEISLNGLTIGGKTIGGSGGIVSYASSTNSLAVDVDVMPPYKSILYLRKVY